jgi:pyruvate/2-oxoacid:ferredoxin oxidoreductase beta subunit
MGRMSSMRLDNLEQMLATCMYTSCFEMTTGRRSSSSEQGQWTVKALKQKIKRTLLRAMECTKTQSAASVPKLSLI